MRSRTTSIWRARPTSLRGDGIRRIGTAVVLGLGLDGGLSGAVSCTTSASRAACRGCASPRGTVASRATTAARGSATATTRSSYSTTSTPTSTNSLRPDSCQSHAIRRERLLPSLPSPNHINKRWEHHRDPCHGPHAHLGRHAVLPDNCRTDKPHRNEERQSRASRRPCEP